MLSAASSHGNLIRSFSVPKLDWRVTTAYALGNILVLFVFFTSVQEPISKGRSIPLLSYFIFFLIVAGWIALNYFIYKQYQKRARLMELFDEGLKITTSVGERFIPYRDIKGVSWNFYRIRKPSKKKSDTSEKIVAEVVIFLTTEQKITYNSNLLPEIEELGELLEQIVADQYLKEVTTKITQGERVSFGLVEIDREAIYFEEYLLWWYELGRLYSEKGNLVLDGESERMVAVLPQHLLINVNLLCLIANKLIAAAIDDPLGLEEKILDKNNQ